MWISLARNAIGMRAGSKISKISNYSHLKTSRSAHLPLENMRKKISNSHKQSQQSRFSKLLMLNLLKSHHKTSFFAKISNYSNVFSSLESLYVDAGVIQRPILLLALIYNIFIFSIVKG
jgi:hypothetical protein